MLQNPHSIWSDKLVLLKVSALLTILHCFELSACRWHRTLRRLVFTPQLSSITLEEIHGLCIQSRSVRIPAFIDH